MRGHYLMATISTALLCGSVRGGDRLVDENLIGAWRLVRTQITLPDGRTFPVPNYGSDPQGYLIYDKSHTMCVYLAVGVSNDLPPAEFRTLMPPIPAAYCARWHIDASGDTVVHEVLVAMDPELLAAPLRRKATLNGRVLQLRRDPVPRGLRDYVLTFERVGDSIDGSKAATMRSGD
jgi:hypothetical protein